jgi:hypothetical protein
MRRKTSWRLLQVWFVFVWVLLVAGVLGGLWARWDARQRALYPPPPERKPHTHGRVIAVKKVGDQTKIEILYPGEGSVWVATAGPDTQVRTSDRLRTELEVEQIVKVWYRAEPAPGQPENYAEYILVEGYRPQWQKP